jgi:DNA-directed RNA polymerase subunit D
MKIIKKTDNKIVFSLKTTESLANAIRRSVYSIPIMAIDEVEIMKNDSALYDETVAHRLGLVPIKMDKSWKEDNVIKFKIKMNKEGFVYSKDISGEFEVVYEDIPITLLKTDQEIKIKGITKMGVGNDHAKFLPGIILFRNLSEITLDKEFEEAIKKVFPEAEIKTKGNKIIIKDNLEKSLLDFCEGLALKNKKESETKETDEIVFTVESFGQIKVDEIFKKAISVLKKDLKGIKIK